MVRILLFAALLGVAMAMTELHPKKVGDKVDLSVGLPGIRVWKRTVKSKSGYQEQRIRYCKPAEKNIACDKWIDKNNKPVASGARVLADGRLIIHSATLADTGSYSSPDDKGVKSVGKNGKIREIPPMMIDVDVTK